MFFSSIGTLPVFRAAISACFLHYHCSFALRLMGFHLLVPPQAGRVCDIVWAKMSLCSLLHTSSSHLPLEGGEMSSETGPLSSDSDIGVEGMVGNSQRPCCYERG